MSECLSEDKEKRDSGISRCAAELGTGLLGITNSQLLIPNYSLLILQIPNTQFPITALNLVFPPRSGVPVSGIKYFNGDRSNPSSETFFRKIFTGGSGHATDSSDLIKV